MRPSQQNMKSIAAHILIVTTLGVGACNSGGSSGPPNILFISIDSLRPDHLSCYGYGRVTSPFLDELAAGGVRFTNAVSTTSWTLPSHAAMFTGLLGPTHGLVDNGLSLSADHVTLAEVMKSEGYHTAGFYAGPYLHPTFGLGQGFDVYKSCMTTTADGTSGQDVRASAMGGNAASHQDITGPRTRDEVATWATERAKAGAGEPYFLFLHMWDVHYDFNPPTTFRDLFVDGDYDGPADGRLMDNAAIRPDMAPADLQHVLDLYDAEIRFTDSILRDIFADLESKGLMENTLVILTADHGEEFFEHGNKGHNKTLFDEVLRVPLIVSWKGQLEGGRVVQDQVQVIDLMPTMVRFAGFQPDLPFQGRDLSPLLAGESMAARDALSGLFIDGGSQRALRSNIRKVLRINDSQPAALVDLRSNPSESFEDMIHPQTPHSQRKRSMAEAQLINAVHKARVFKELLGLRKPNSIEISETMRERLTALGYIEADK